MDELGKEAQPVPALCKGRVFVLSQLSQADDGIAKAPQAASLVLPRLAMACLSHLVLVAVAWFGKVMLVLSKVKPLGVGETLGCTSPNAGDVDAA